MRAMYLRISEQTHCFLFKKIVNIQNSLIYKLFYL